VTPSLASSRIGPQVAGRLKVAIIHYWLVGMRGGEKVLEAFCQLFPQADIYTHVYVPENISEIIRRHRITTTFIGSLPAARRLYKHYLPLMPLALEQLDLREYDLIISSEAGPAKGVLAPPSAPHLCYCHSPMRYLWNMFHDYRAQLGRPTGLMMPPIAHYLRMWDAVSAGRVDRFIANSINVAGRIRRYYNHDAKVVWPPVSVQAFEAVPSKDVGDYMLMVGELVAYKRPELAVEAFNRLKAKLVVIGGGEMLDKIRRLAGPTVTVMGACPFEELRHHYARCQALIFPGEEDFGIVPVEAMASGRPVIAYGRGGATETVVPGLTGILFEDHSVDGLIEAIQQFRGDAFDPQRIVAHAGQFSRERFLEQMTAQIDDLLSGGRHSPVLRSDIPAEPARLASSGP
jgi:glycosyltransferase involved in cell wall biosynthesis